MAALGASNSGFVRRRGVRKMNKREERVWDQVYALVYAQYARNGDESWKTTACRAEEAANKAVDHLRGADLNAAP